MEHKMITVDIDTTNMYSHLRHKLMDFEGKSLRKVAKQTKSRLEKWCSVKKSRLKK